jgi:hypothetical protein
VLPGAAGGCGWLGGSVADGLADEDDVDAAGQFLVDFQDLADLAVLPVGGLRAGVFQREAVLVDPLVRALRNAASTAVRAASRSSTTSVLNPCSSSATTVACSAFSSGSVVKRSGIAVVLTAGPP